MIVTKSTKRSRRHNRQLLTVQIVVNDVSSRRYCSQKSQESELIHFDRVVSVLRSKIVSPTRRRFKYVKRGKGVGLLDGRWENDRPK